MSDILDALNILAGMTNTIADYKLSKDKLESAKQHEIDILNRKQQADIDRTNINTTLNYLGDRLKENEEDIKTKSDVLVQAGQNVNEIINLPVQFQTKGGNDTAENQQSRSFSDLTQSFALGNTIGETIDNQNAALDGTKFALNQLDLLNTINKNIIQTTNTELLNKGEDVTVSLKNFQDLFKTQEFKDEFKERLGFAMGEDDLTTPNIDESQIDINTLLSQGAESRMKTIGDMSLSQSRQVELENKILNLEQDKTAGPPMKMYYSKDLGKNINLTNQEAQDWYKDNPNDMLFPQASMSNVSGSGSSKSFEDKFKIIQKELSGSLATDIERINAMQDNIGGGELNPFAKDPQSYVGDSVYYPKETDFDTVEGTKFNVNRMETDLGTNLISYFGYGASKEKSLFEFMAGSPEVEIQKAAESGQLYTTFDENGNVKDRGVVDIVLGIHKPDGSAYSPGKGRVDSYAVAELDLGRPMFKGTHESFAVLYETAKALKRIENVKTRYPEISWLNPDLSIETQTDEKGRSTSNYFNNTKINKTLEDADLISMGGDKFDRQIDRSFKPSTQENKISSVPSMTFSEFTNSINNKFDAKEYAGGFGANALYMAVRNYKSNPTASNKSKLESLYRKYTK